MSEEQLHLEDAKKLYRKAVEEFEIAREKNDRIFLCDACAKGWLSAIEATYALLLKKGVKDGELLKADWGRRYMVHRYAEKELELYYFSLRDNLHIECYYERSLDFDEVQIRLDDLKYYIEKIEELEEVRR
uniref:HEPN domain-containing protein n=1 Tax=Candidatus Methanophagaceae archaeon ANME-1 ERB6 TaxID=2759912 RepID=A0A7G9YZK0_9EURY|nr:hypothetical protein HCHKDHBN_00004 [Methanosarcinales archaeon ANME-1 ERB6]